MGRIIIDPRAAQFNSERQAPQTYGRSTFGDVGTGLDLVGKGLTVAQMAGDIAGPIVVGLGNMGVEDQTRQAQTGLLDLQRKAAENRGAAARQMMASAQPQPERYGRRGVEEAFAPPLAEPDADPMPQAVDEPSPLQGMLQPGYKNPYGMRFDAAPAGQPAPSPRARAADLMLGSENFKKIGRIGDINAFDAPDVDELDWSHEAPTDRRSIGPKSALQPRDMLRGLSPFIDKVAPQEEQIPPGIFGPPQQMPQPGTPEFRQLLEAQQPTAETMSAGFGDSAMNLLRRVTGGATAKAARPASRQAGRAVPSLQQRADSAQVGVDQQLAEERDVAGQALLPAEQQTGKAIQTSEEMQQIVRDRAAESGPDAAEQALQARLQSAQNRLPVQVEDYDYSVPQLEALIIQAKQSGDPDTINKVAQAINSSSLRGTRAQSVFADMLGGAHVGRERQRLLGNLSGVASKPESAADLAGDLSKATYQRRVGERMEAKPYEFIEKAGMNQGKMQLSTSKAVSKAPETAANVVARSAAAKKSLTEAQMVAPKAKAQIASQYASANQANSNAKRIRTMLPWDVALANKKLNEVPREGKGMNFTFNGGAGSPESAKLMRKIRDEGAVVAAKIAPLLSSPEVTQLKGVRSKDAGKMMAKWSYDARKRIAEAGEYVAILQAKRAVLGDAALDGVKLADTLGLSKDEADTIRAISQTPEFQSSYNKTKERLAKEEEGKTAPDGTDETDGTE
jgi:hypothetical protein